MSSRMCLPLEQVERGPTSAISVGIESSCDRFIVRSPVVRFSVTGKQIRLNAGLSEPKIGGSPFTDSSQVS